MSDIVSTPELDFVPRSVPAVTARRRSIRARLAAAFEAPSPRVRRAAGLGAAVLPLAIAFAFAREVTSALGPTGIVLAYAAIVTAGLLLLAGVLRLVRRFLDAAPRFLGWLGTATVVAAIVPFLLTLFGAPPFGVALLGTLPLPFAIVGVVLLCSFLGAYAAIMTSRESRGGRARQVGLTLAAAAAVAVLALTFSWLASPGVSTKPVVAAPAVAAAPIGEPDPSLRGPYSVRTMTYGSGSDRRRPEFGGGVSLMTGTVDGRPFVKDLTGFRDSARRRYWGFGPEAYPLNARVWVPEGKGPFPLVLVAHGNYDMGTSSDRGFAWLGELLASRGMIVASVDENFLNMSLTLSLGIAKDTAARAWLVLEHLRVWREWNGAAGNPFHGRVDLDRIALIGHSRGGEAVALAAAFNKLERFPDDARIAFDYDFPIRAVVAIAPSDGQYNPGGRPVALEDVNYLVLQGASDGDLTQFLGDRQYNRVRFSGEGDWFKASVYIHRANHGQFNPEWRRADQQAPISWFLNQQPLLSGEEQRRAASVAVSGFLEAALRDRRAYRELFRNDMAAAAPWLPKTTYVTRREESSFRLLADYEEDPDVTTTTAPGGVVKAEGLSLWREQDASLRRNGIRRKQAVYLGWTPSHAAPSYALTLPAEFAAEAKLDGAAKLVLDIAELDENPDPGAARRERRKEPLDLTVELRDGHGNVSRLPLSRFGRVQLPSKPRFTKWAALEPIFGVKPEPVFSTVELPLADFATAASGFAPDALQSVTLAFDRSDRGVVAVNRVGFAR